MKRGFSILVVGVGAVAFGCSNKLETGYEPRTIGSNQAERRGYYAAPFSPEAREARERAEVEGSDTRRPRPGY